MKWLTCVCLLAFVASCAQVREAGPYGTKCETPNESVIRCSHHDVWAGGGERYGVTVTMHIVENACLMREMTVRRGEGLTSGPAWSRLYARDNLCDRVWDHVESRESPSDRRRLQVMQGRDQRALHETLDWLHDAVVPVSLQGNLNGVHVGTFQAAARQ